MRAFHWISLKPKFGAVAACIRERGIVWNDREEVLIGSGEVADTKNNPLYFRLAHLGYAHPADLWDEQGLAATARPEAFSLLPDEQIDIDTPEDLAFARVVYAGQRNQ